MKSIMICCPLDGNNHAECRKGVYLSALKTKNKSKRTEVLLDGKDIIVISDGFYIRKYNEYFDNDIIVVNDEGGIVKNPTSYQKHLVALLREHY